MATKAGRPSDESRMYTLVCRERFESVHSDIEELKIQEIIPLRKDVEYLKTRIDNGLSRVPGLLRALIAIFISIALAAVGAMGYWIYKMGRLESSFESHLQWGQQENEKRIEDMEEIQSTLESMEETLHDHSSAD